MLRESSSYYKNYSEMKVILKQGRLGKSVKSVKCVHNIECFLNKVLDHADILKSNLPYEEHMSEDVEDEVVLCEKLIDMALKWVDLVKPLYYLDNSFERFHVEPEFEESYFIKKRKIK